MDIHIHLDDRFVRPFRLLLRKPVVRTAAALAVMISAGALYAQTLTQFQPGEVISSSQVNANFAALEARIAAIETDGAKLRGYEIVRASFDLDPGEVDGVTMDCPTGKRAVGGGWMNDATHAPGTEIIWDRATNCLPFDGCGWQIILQNTNTGGFSRHIIAHAICVDVD